MTKWNQLDSHIRPTVLELEMLPSRHLCTQQNVSFMYILSLFYSFSVQKSSQNDLKMVLQWIKFLICRIMVISKEVLRQMSIIFSPIERSVWSIVWGLSCLLIHIYVHRNLDYNTFLTLLVRNVKTHHWSCTTFKFIKDYKIS